MIYAMRSPFIYEDRFKNSETVWPEKPPGLEHHPRYTAYQHFREPLHYFNYPNCLLSKSPLLPDWYRPTRLNVKLKRGYFPDMYIFAEEIYVSSKAKQALEQFEPSAIQFTPVQILVQSPSLTEQLNYFTLNVRHHIQLAEAKDKAYQCAYYVSNATTRSISFLQNNSDLYKAVSKLPFCMINAELRELYINSETLEALRSENITGIKEDINGREGECTVRRIQLRDPCKV